jgi:hypothetical protein
MRNVPVIEYFQVIDKCFDAINRSAQLFLDLRKKQLVEKRKQKLAYDFFRNRKSNGSTMHAET